MSEQSSLMLSADFPAPNTENQSSTLGRDEWIMLFEVAIAFLLIMITVWTPRPLQTWLFWTSAGWVLACTVMSAQTRRLGCLKLPSLKIGALMLISGVLIAAGLMATGAAAGTFHMVLNAKEQARHAAGYIFWAVVQQFIQQAFFFVRLERLTRSGLMASALAAFLFGVAHLPNPVLAPVTFLGGWLLSELFRRYRTLLPLGIGHGLVGIAIALSVPDHIQHHMRVGLGYLRYIG